MSTPELKEIKKSRFAILSSSTAAQDQEKSSSGIIGPKSSRGLNLSRIRKQSYGFGSIPAVGGRTRRRTSQAGWELKRPPLIYLNTYQLAPRVRFDVPMVKKAVNSILDVFYNDSKYNAIDSPIITMLIADKVMRLVKDMNFNRYRIISVVTLAQKRSQSYNNAVAFLWDHEFDGLVDVNREDNTSFIQVTVFGVYLD